MTGHASKADRPIAAFSGAVLAGGRSRRMGRDKAFIEIDGQPLVARAADRLTAAGAADVHVIGGDTARVASLGLTAVADPVPFTGPLAGLLTALDTSTEPVVAVLACDLPDLDAEAIRATVDALGTADAAVPLDADGVLQWLHSAWRVRSADRLRSAYEQGERAIRRAVDGLVVRPVTGIRSDALRDADTPGELPASAYPAPMPIAEIDIDEFAERHRAGVPVLDVRQPEEYEEAHVPGVVLIPLDQLPDRLDEVPTGDLHVICKLGGRSARAVEFLAANGVTATNVDGGTVGWIDAGHPVDRGTGSS